ncbi:nucleotide exchange factor GrpE [Helicobacter didelphidarum]|nr:nucleotide exchange factor GrpE [Helicobacter didelphidarum]
MSNEEEYVESPPENIDEDSTQESNELDNIESLKQKIKELEDQYLRTHADFENVKKRLEREKSQALEYAHEKILKDILPIADTLEKALESAKLVESGEKIAEGIKLTIDNLHKVFKNHGMEVIDTDNEFDPNLHDAIMHANHPDKEDGQIAQVLQKGYKYKERTLRPAMVSVVKNS